MIRPNLKQLTTGRSRMSIAVIIFAGLMLAFLGAGLLQGQAATEAPIVGERLTYNVSFGQFDNIAYVEFFTASRGKLSGRDAVELRAKIKTFDLIGAAFYSVDETRKTFASAETGYPLYVSKIENNLLEPKETTANYLNTPATSFDLLTLIAKARDAAGSGSFSFTENDKIYTATFAPTGSEKVKTGAGEFDTVVSNVDSAFLLENGITDLRINFTSDDQKIPVLFRFKVRKSVVSASLSSREIVAAEPEVTSTPAVVPTPIVIRTPRPEPTPTPYVDNQPLSPELPFSLGETLEYSLSNGGRTIGAIALAAKERKLFAGEDSLLLVANVKSLEPGVSVLDRNDVITAQVNPESLAPRQFDMKFTAGLRPFSQSAKFDQKSGTVTMDAGNPTDIPVGTHSLLTFFYAVRTINLRPSKDLSNPINDTRIAVFWDSRAYIFTLRPANSVIVDQNGKKKACLLVSVTTGNPQLDQLAIKIWLSDDARRLPLRITFGSYQADLVQ